MAPNASLGIFVVVVGINVLGLVLDLVLYNTGELTITERVWKAPALGVPVLLWQVLGLLALAAHFYWKE